jgi:hypothetical protein
MDGTLGLTDERHFRPINDQQIQNLATALDRYVRWQEFQIELKERQCEERLRRQLRQLRQPQEDAA